MPIKYANNASAPLAASLGTSSTSITVSSGYGASFPSLGAGEYFYATLTNSSNAIEIVKVTSRSSDTLTAVRAQEGTTALSWAAADKIELRITAADLSNFSQLDAANAFTGANTFSGTITSSGANTFSSTNAFTGAVSFSTIPTFGGGALPVASGGTGVTTSTGTGSTVLSVSPTFTGTPLAPTAATSTNTTQLATTAFVKEALKLLYPVGCIFTSTVGTDPGTLFGFGTWAAYAPGRVLVGQGSNQGATYTAGATSGNKDVTGLPEHNHIAQSYVNDPGHLHGMDAWYNGGNQMGPNAGAGTASSFNTYGALTGITVSTTVNTTGGNVTDTNMQPYVVVYMWRRVT